MAGATLTITDTIPAMGKNLIYFSVTLDGDKKADFSAYTAVHFISARDASTLAPEDASAYTAGGDITFTNASNPVKGIAIVDL